MPLLPDSFVLPFLSLPALHFLPEKLRPAVPADRLLPSLAEWPLWWDRAASTPKYCADRSHASRPARHPRHNPWWEEEPGRKWAEVGRSMEWAQNERAREEQRRVRRRARESLRT